VTITLLMGEPPERDAFILDQGFSYSREHWTSRLPNADQWPTILDGRPAAGRWPFLDRRDVFVMADIQSPEDAVHLFVAACVWGTGVPGRDVSPRVKVLRDNPGAGRHLLAAIAAMRWTGRSPGTGPCTRVELTG
jgi:hypothetical protein